MTEYAVVECKGNKNFVKSYSCLLKVFGFGKLLRSCQLCTVIVISALKMRFRELLNIKRVDNFSLYDNSRPFERECLTRQVTYDLIEPKAKLRK